MNPLSSKSNKESTMGGKKPLDRGAQRMAEVRSVDCCLRVVG